MSIYAGGGGTTSFSGGTTDAMDSQRLLRNAHIVSRAFPQFASDPASLLQVAGVNMDSASLASQITSLSATRVASNDLQWLTSLSKAGQRAAWGQMTYAQQQGYSALGYDAPSSGGQKSNSNIFGDITQAVGGAAGDVWSGIDSVTHNVAAPVMEALGRIGQSGVEMYRAIRQQPEWVQAAAGVAAIAVGTVLTAATGGADLAFLGGGAATVGAGLATEGLGVAGTGFASLASAYSIAGIVATAQGNPGYWGHTFDESWTRHGEGIFERGALDKATKSLDDDGQINALAQSLALSPQRDHGDASPVARLVREFASRRQADSDQARMQAVQEIALKYAGGDPSTDQYQQAFAGLETLSREPRFMEALTALEQAKISPGRDFADVLHLPKESPIYSMVSGAADAAFLFTVDPILASGKVLAVQRALRAGITASDMVSFGNYTSRIETLAQRSSIQRAWGTMADYMGRSDPAGLFKTMPNATNLYAPMTAWANEKAADLATKGAEFRWSTNEVEAFFKDQAGMKALTSGQSVAGPANQLLQVPHLTPVQSAALRARTEVRSVISALDDANMKFRWELKGGLGPDYDLATHIAGGGIRKPELSWGGGLAYSIVEHVPVLKQVGESAGSFFNTMLTHIPTSGEVLLNFDKASSSLEATDNVMRFVDLGRFAGMPTAMRHEWQNAILSSSSTAARRNMVRSFYETMFDHLGVNATPEGESMVRRFLGQEDKAYALDRDHGTWLSEMADHILVPRAKELRHAANQQTILNKFLNLTDANIIDSAVNKVWKPSVLLRVGFITRAVGDEMLSWLARGGLYQQVAGSMARSLNHPEPVFTDALPGEVPRLINATEQMVGHVRWLGSLERSIYGLADKGVSRFYMNGLPDLEQGLLMRYSKEIRGVYRQGLLGGYLDKTSLPAQWGKALLAPENSLRSLVFNGVPNHMIVASDEWFNNPAVRSIIMREVSASKHSMAHDIATADPYSDEAIYRGFDSLDPEIVDRLRLQNGWIKADPMSNGYDYAAWKNQNTVINGADAPFDDAALSSLLVEMADSRIMDTLAATGIGAEDLQRIAATAQPDIRQVFTTALATDDTRALGAALNKVKKPTEEIPSVDQLYLRHQGVKHLQSEQDVKQWLAKVSTDPKASADMQHFANAALALHNHEDVATQRWLAAWLEHDGAGVITGWSEEARDALIKDALRHQLVDNPSAMRTWSTSEDSVVTAETNRRVARPAPDGVQKRYLPAPTTAGTEALQQMADRNSPLLQRMYASTDPKTAEIIGRMAANFHGYPDHVAEMIDQSLSQPLWWAFADPEQAAKVTKVLNQLGGIERHDLVASMAELDLPAKMTNNTSLVGRWDDHNALVLKPEAVQASYLIHPGEGLISVNGELMPGASQAEALEEHLNMKVAAWKERFHSPMATSGKSPEEFKDPITEIRPINPADPNGPVSMSVDGNIVNTTTVPETLHQDGGDPFILLGADHPMGIDAAIDPYAVSQDYESGLAYLSGHTKGEQPLPTSLQQQLEDHPMPESSTHINAMPWEPATSVRDFAERLDMEVAPQDILTGHGSNVGVIGDPSLEKEFGGIAKDENGFERAQQPSHLIIAKPMNTDELKAIDWSEVKQVYLTQEAAEDVWLRIRLAEHGADVREIVPHELYDDATFGIDDMRTRVDPEALEAYITNKTLHVPHTNLQPDALPAFEPPPGVTREMVESLPDAERYLQARALANHLAGFPVSHNGVLTSTPYAEHVADQWLALPWGRTNAAAQEASGLSQQVANHLAQQGISVEQIQAHLLDGGGDAAYQELIQRHVAHLAAGDSAGDSIDKALRGIGFPMPDENVPLTSRVLWESVGPQMLDRHATLEGRELYDHGSGSTVQVGHADNMRDVPTDDRPRNVVAPKWRIPDEQGYWDKIVQFGFGKVIGPSIDKMIRTPLAFSNFAAAYRDALPTSRWMRDAALFAEKTDERVVDVTTSELVHPWSQGERFRLAGVSTSHGVTPEAQEALKLSSGEPWFDVYGQPSRWLRNNLDALDQHLPADSTLRELISNVQVNREVTTVEAKLGEGQFRAATRQAWETKTQFKMNALDRVGVKANLEELGLLGPGEDVALGLGRLRAAPQRALEEIGRYEDATQEVGRFDKLREWLDTPPPNLDDAVEEVVSLGHQGVIPLWAQDKFGTESGSKLLDRALASDRQATRTVVENAMHRAIVDTTPFIDRDNVRSQWQEYVHNLVPFWFAEEQFMRRLGKTILMHPEALRKAQIVYSGLKSGGVIRTDEFGNDIFVYPGSAVVADVIGRLPFLSDKLPVASAMTGQVMYSLPGIDRFGVPQVSPLVAIPMAQIAAIFPEMQPAQQALAGNRGAGQGVIRALVPTSVMRFYDAIMSNDGDRRLSSAMKTAAEVLEANGHGLPDGADTYTQTHYIDRLKNTARTILLAQAFFGFVGPASPDYQMVGVQGKPGQSGGAWDLPGLLGVHAPDALLNDEYIKLVQSMGAEAGTQAFLARYPDSTPSDLFNSNIVYRVGQSTSVSGAPLPPTHVAEEFLSKNYQWAKENPLAAGWLVPPARTPQEAAARDINTWTDQMAIGLRERKSPEEMIRSLKFAVASETYFTTRKQMQDQIDTTSNKHDQLDLKTQMGLWTTAFLSTHPMFSEELASGAGRERRARTLQELRLAFLDPAAPTPWHGQNLKTMIDNLDQYQTEKAALTGSRTKAAQRKSDGYDRMFSTWGDEFVTKHPELRTFWLGVIKPEAGIA